MQNTLSKLVELLQLKMDNSFLRKTRTQFCAAVCQKSVCKVWSWFVKSFSYWSSSSVHHPKTFPWRNSSIKFLLKSLASNKSILEQKSKYLSLIRVFPFLHLIFLLEWNKKEIFKRRHEKDQKQSFTSACNFIKKRLCLRCFPVNFAKFRRILF